MSVGVAVGNWAFFWTTYRSKKLLKGLTHAAYWRKRGAKTAVVQLAVTLDLGEALAAARAAGLFGVGTHQVGCFEVQTPIGIYWHARGYYNLNKAKAVDVRFQSWEDLEAADTRP